jgi:hypothetical protein
MARSTYENFDLVFTHHGGETYRAAVRDAPGGDAAVTFTLSGAPPTVAATVARNFTVGGPAPVTDVPIFTQDVGRYLFDTVFQNDLLANFKVSLDRVRRANAFMRVRLDLTEVPDLVGLPWEMLASASSNMALSVETSVVRYQALPFPVDRLAVNSPPLRVLVIISNPSAPGLPPLMVEKEFDLIRNSLQPLMDKGLVELERLPTATVEELQNRLFQPEPLHIIHYIGHGTFDAATGQGQLVFEGEGGVGFSLVDGQTFGQSLQAQNSVRLVILNACEGAMVSRTEAFAGVAQEVLRRGNVPAVVAMRTVVSDDIAIAFAETFYKWLLVNNLSADAAMTRARLRVRDVEQQREPSRAPLEWATPILFMREHDGYLVDFQAGAQAPPAQPVSFASGPSLPKHYLAVVAGLTKGRLVPFLGLDVNLIGRSQLDPWVPGTVLPGYKELVQYLATRSGQPVPFIPALADVSQYALLHEEREGPFYEDLSAIFSRPAEPTSLHQFWAKIAAHNEALTASVSSGDDSARRFLIVSNTYDNLLETAFKREGIGRFHLVSYVAHGGSKGKFRHTIFAKPQGGSEAIQQASVVIENANSYLLYDQAPVILKFPGTAGDVGGGRFAITEDQYFDLLDNRELSSVLPGQLLTKLRTSSHLFLGYNVREWCLRALLYRLWEVRKPPFDSWAVADDPPDVERTYWKACDVDLIESDLAEYLSELRRYFASLAPGI